MARPRPLLPPVTTTTLPGASRREHESAVPCPAQPGPELLRPARGVFVPPLPRVLRRRKVSEQTVSDGIEERLLVADAAVERYWRHAETRRNVAHADRIKAELLENLHGRGDDLVGVQIEVRLLGHKITPPSQACRPPRGQPSVEGHWGGRRTEPPPSPHCAADR